MKLEDVKEEDIEQNLQKNGDAIDTFLKEHNNINFPVELLG